MDNNCIECAKREKEEIQDDEEHKQESKEQDEMNTWNDWRRLGTYIQVLYFEEQMTTTTYDEMLKLWGDLKILLPGESE